MLIEFTVDNFLSFRDRTTLSMAGSPDRSHMENLITLPIPKGSRLLRSAAIYGANASGKSNLIKAIRFVKRFVMNSSREGQRDSIIEVIPFKLDRSYASRPSSFEVMFLIDGKRYSYGFSAYPRYISSEFLYSYPKGQRRLLFERTQASEDDLPFYKFGSHWQGDKKPLENVTRKNALFLSVASQFNNLLCGNVTDWFSRTLRFVGSVAHEHTKISIHENEYNRFCVLQLLKHADLAIKDLKLDSVPLKNSKQYEKLPDEVKRIVSEKEQDAFLLELTTIHEGIAEDGSRIDVPFGFDEESDGTKQYFGLAGHCFDTLYSGCTLVIDELDSHLHPLLTKEILRRFHSGQSGASGGQIIFTAHDAALLDLDIFRRDQIWFTAKDEGGATSLYSLYEFKGARKDENISRGYLAGRYGAIPFVYPGTFDPSCDSTSQPGKQS